MPLVTTPPESARVVVLYDGHCRFCTASAKELAARVGEDRVELASLHEPGALERFPGVTFEACMKRLHVVMPDGRVFDGSDAVAHALAAAGGAGKLALGITWPGVRWIAQLVYDQVAKRRYRIAAKDHACDDGTCKLHVP